jgi:hypothetical protein
MALHRRRLALDALTVMLAIAGVTLVVIGASPPPQRARGAAEAVTPPDESQDPQETQGPPGPTAPPPGVASTPPAGPAPGPAPLGPAPLGRSVPVHLEIPAIGVSTPTMELGLNPDGTIAVPPLRHDAPAGWYRHLATPGEIGPAIFLGHVDTARDGPAVFFRLRELRAGDTITVRRTDGSSAVFTVSQVVEYPKSAFPTDTVYGALDHPGLRLVTCGGSFDRIRREYRGNVVAYAHLTASFPAPDHVK